MSAVEVVRIPVAPEAATSLVDAIRRGRAGYLAPPACQDVEVLRHAEGTEVIVVATWASVAAHDEAAARPAAAAFLGEVGGLAAGPPSVGFYERG
jgi:quinol monooxygenase YgiN